MRITPEEKPEDRVRRVFDEMEHYSITVLAHEDELVLVRRGNPNAPRFTLREVLDQANRAEQ